jgi:hypothetical protein
VDAGAFRLGFALRGCEAAIAGTEAYLDQNREGVAGDATARDDLTDELRRHREIVRGYEEELAGLRQELAKVRDVAGGVEALVDESRIRAELLEAIERERLAAEAARGSVAPPERALFERVDAARERLAEVRSRARALEVEVVADATRRAGELRARVGEEKVALASQEGALDGAQATAQQLLGGLAVRSIAEVRGQFYRLVLKADVGNVDVAWSRKRQRLDKIQQLAVQKDAEVEQLDREYRALLREVD